MQLARDGAEHHPAALGPAELADLELALSGLPPERPGLRLTEKVPGLLGPLSLIARLATGLLGPLSRPVRALLFNKNAAQNWSLAWHQDRTIAVRRRIDTAGFENWTVKTGIPHVEPPFALLERMIRSESISTRPARTMHR